MSKKFDKSQILNFFKNNRKKLIDHYHIMEVNLIGSFAKNTYTDDSDVDLVFTLKENQRLNFKMYMELLYWLEDNFDRKVDLINKKNINPLILKTSSDSMQALL